MSVALALPQIPAQTSPASLPLSQPVSTWAVVCESCFDSWESNPLKIDCCNRDSVNIAQSFRSQQIMNQFVPDADGF